MDISKITDAKELKSMAYDQMVAVEQAQANLRLINQRLAQLQQEQMPQIKAEDKKEETKEE